MIDHLDTALSRLAGLLAEEPGDDDSGEHSLIGRVEKGLQSAPKKPTAASEMPTGRVRVQAPAKGKDIANTPAHGTQQPFLKFSDIRDKAQKEGGLVYVNSTGDHALIAFSSKDDVLDFVNGIPNPHQIGTFLGCRNTTGQKFGKSQIVAVELKKG